MDLNKVFTKIKELGHINSKRDELREYCKLKIDQILTFLPRRILNSDGGDLLDCIFIGLPVNPSSKYKAKIVDIVLTSMRKESTSLTHCGDVISRLCLELPRLPAQDLVRWCNDSVQSIIEDSDVNMIWKDVLPECLSALTAHTTIQHCGTDMTVQEYKEQCTRALCQCRWQEKQLVPLTAMFRDMQLPCNDHKQVVNKICSYIIDFPPDALPPLVHQLLKLCKSYHVEIVLAHLSHYFSIRLYSKLEPPPQDSESTTMDIDDIAQHSPLELSRCLSTCIYHMSAGAAEPDTIRKHIKAWPRTQLLRNPFLIDLALALSDKGADFRTVCLDVVRSAVEARVTDAARSAESCWSRAVLPPDVDVPQLLKLLTTESANHRQLTVVGLINLAFALLSVSRTKPCAPACWSHGKLILARLSKSQPETAPHILSQLCDRLATDNSRQYADCLHVLCALTPVSLERCTQLTLILENCQPVPGDYKSAAAVLDAVHPLLSFSTRVRDVLVMVCRKGLYSRDSMHRCLALSGFLTVLRHVKLSRTFSSSQSTFSEQFSAHSYLTQVAVDVHADQGNSQVTSRVRNEAMCMEVVSILRRCLVQDAAVKELLYTKIYDCSKEKPVLHEAILELLYEHLSKYLPETDGDPPLMFDKCVQVTAVNAILTEPIARLLYCVAQFLSVEDEDLEDILESQGSVGDTGSAHLRSKLGSIIDTLASQQDLGRIHVSVEHEDLEDILESQGSVGDTGSAHLRSKLGSVMDTLASQQNLGRIHVTVSTAGGTRGPGGYPGEPGQRGRHGQRTPAQQAWQRYGHPGQPAGLGEDPCLLLQVEHEDLEDILESQGSVGDTGSAHLRSKLGSVMDTLASQHDLGRIHVTVEHEDLEDILESQGSAHLRSKLGIVIDTLASQQDLGRIHVTVSTAGGTRGPGGYPGESGLHRTGVKLGSVKDHQPQEEPGLTDLTPESKAKSLKLQQVLSCYEALIAHQVTAWSATSAGAATKVYDLFTAAHQLLEQTKVNPKLGKKGSKSTLNETRETQRTQKSQKSQKEKGKAPVKVSNLVKDRSGPFKPLPCIWDLRMCHRVLELLYNENVPWCSLEERNQLRSKRDFHHWALLRITSVVSAAADKREAKPVQDIAALLYKRTICRFQDMCNFDEQTTVECVELFRECLALLVSPRWALRMNSFLPAITGLQDETVSSSVAAILEQIHSALQLIEEESAEERDVTGKRLVAAFIQTAAVLLETPIPASRETTAVITKLEQYVRQSKQECLPLIPPLLTASYRELQEAALLDHLLIKLTHVLGKIDEEETSGGGEEPGHFPAIDAKSGHTVLCYICAHLSRRHRCLEHLLQRGRDLAAATHRAVHAHQHRIEKGSNKKPFLT
ncbi:hypothetical protein O0L34_g5042 [Tuta absoluta]|nr:hypothetical protein O0L34_g5042 [Tuta absoluta]